MVYYSLMLDRMCFTLLFSPILNLLTVWRELPVAFSSSKSESVKMLTYESSWCQNKIKNSTTNY